MPTSLPRQARRSHCSNAPFILECEVDGRPTAVPEEKKVKLEEMKSKEIWSMVFNRGVELVEPEVSQRRQKKNHVVFTHNPDEVIDKSSSIYRKI